MAMTVIRSRQAAVKIAGFSRERGRATLGRLIGGKYEEEKIKLLIVVFC